MAALEVSRNKKGQVAQATRPFCQSYPDTG